MSAIPLSAIATSGCIQQDFLALLPAISNHARIRFRHLPPHEREEAIAETIAASYVNFVRLARQGKLGQAYVSTLSDYAARATAQGRHVGGHQSVNDVMSPLAQKKRGFSVRRLPQQRNYYIQWEELIAETRKFSPVDTAALRVDFESWFYGFSDRDRRIIECLAAGEGTMHVADRFGVSEARVSQLRRKYERSWGQFQGEVLAAAA